jgi:hypothetical protein
MNTELSQNSHSEFPSSAEQNSLMEIEILMGDMMFFSPVQPVLTPIDCSFEDELELESFELERRRPRAHSDSFILKRKYKQIRKLSKRRGSIL